MSLKTEQVERFRKVANAINGELVIIVAQVDPDALGAALGLKYILEQLVPTLDGRVKIAFCGRFSHPQNRSIFNHFDLGRTVRPISEFAHLAKNCQVALVDSSTMADNRLPQAWQELKPLIVIDHHKSELPPPEESQFYWIETTQVASASTMVAEIATSLKLNLNEMVNLLLTLGIYTDTNALVDSHPRDRTAYGEVTKNLNGPQLSQLTNYSLTRSYFVNLQSALASMRQDKSFLVASVGVIALEDADDISTIAGYLGRMEGVTLAVVFGIVGDKVRLSARSSNPGRSLDAFLKERFGENNAGAKLTPHGRSEGGALMNLDLGVWTSTNPRVIEHIESMVQARLEELIFGGEEKKTNGH